MSGPENLENRALCFMVGNLQGNASPTPTFSTVQPTVYAQRRVEGMGVNILLEKPGQTSFMSTFKLYNLLGKGIRKARKPPFKIKWLNSPEQIRMRKGCLGRESLHFSVYHGAEARAARIPPSPTSVGLKNSVVPIEP